jgi:hypothetical protein
VEVVMVIVVTYPVAAGVVAKRMFEKFLMYK